MWQDIKNNPGVFGAGVALGVVVLLVLVLIFKWVYGELFVDPNSNPPVVNQLLQAHFRKDPPRSSLIGKGGAYLESHEHFAHSKDPILISKLWNN